MMKLNKTHCSGFGGGFGKRSIQNQPLPPNNMNVTFFGGSKFHSSKANWSPHRSTLRYKNSKANLYRFSPRESGELHAEMRF